MEKINFIGRKDNKRGIVLQLIHFLSSFGAKLTLAG
jgi:hypothetical protein